MKVRPDDAAGFQRGALKEYEAFAGTRIVVFEGCGLNGHKLVREVTYWFDENDILIARSDPAERP